MYRVLIVEDDILMGAALKQMVERDPAFQVVHTAITGQEGIQVCREKLVDLIFLDVQLPGITGDWTDPPAKSPSHYHLYDIPLFLPYLGARRSQGSDKGCFGKAGDVRRFKENFR